MFKRVLTISLAVIIILPVAPLQVRCDEPSEEAPQLSFEERHADKSFIFLLYSIDVKLNDDWSYSTTYRKRVKVLKEDAREMGEIPIYYESGRETITGLDAFTVSPDGRKHKATRIQDLNIYPGDPMYSDFMMKTVTLPEVTVGSVLEHGYTVVSKGLALKNAFWDIFNIDSDVPMKKLVMSVTVPKAAGVRYKEFNLTRMPVITGKGGSVTYSWDVDELDGKDPAEDYMPMPTPGNISENVEFSSLGSWKEISDWFMSLEKANIRITPGIEAAALGVTAGAKTVKEKTRSILEYMQRDFRYVSMSFGNNTLEPHPTDEVFANKYGDCKDLSLLCKAMLGCVGIDSDICLFNTESSINDPEYDLPIPTLFDHVLLRVKDGSGGDFYVDPLLKGYDIGEYPVGYQMAYVFVVTKDGGRFERFPEFDETRGYTGLKKTIKISPDGSALVEADSVWDLDFSVGHRDNLNMLNNREKEKFFEGLCGYLASGGDMIECELRGLDDKYGVIKPHNKVKLINAYPVTGDYLIIDIQGFDRGMEFTQKERVNPIFYPTNSVNEEVTDYRFPEGYEPVYTPPDLELSTGFVSLSRRYTRSPGGISMTEVTRYKRVELPSTEYEKLKEFYDKLLSRTAQRIILKSTGAPASPRR